MLLGVQYLDLTGQFKVRSGHLFGTLHRKSNGLRFIGEELKAYFADVQKKRDHVFFHAFNSGKFVRNSRKLHVGDSRAGKRGENDAAQRIAERVAVARVEPVYFIRTASLRLGDDAGLAWQCDV